MIIGFTGSMGSGKSTAIDCIKELQHKKVYNIKFAQPLYDMQEYVYRRVSTVYERPSTFIKDRKLLQFLGTDWGRETINDTVWIDLWKQEVKSILNSTARTIITCDDVRFDNEAEAIKSMGGIVVKLESTHSAKRIDINAGITGHKSESGVKLELVDCIIENNGSIDDLRSSLLTLNSIKALW